MNTLCAKRKTSFRNKELFWKHARANLRCSQNCSESTEYEIRKQEKIGVVGCLLKKSAICVYLDSDQIEPGPSQPGLAPGVNGAPNPLKNEKKI